MDQQNLRALVEGMYMKHLDAKLSPQAHEFLDKHQELFVEGFLEHLTRQWGDISRAPSINREFLEFLEFVFHVYMIGVTRAFLAVSRGF